MPQMSPMLWFNLYIYFILIMLIIMFMIYNIKLVKNLNKISLKFIYYNYLMKW